MDASRNYLHRKMTRSMPQACRTRKQDSSLARLILKATGIKRTILTVLTLFSGHVSWRKCHGDYTGRGYDILHARTL